MKKKQANKSLKNQMNQKMEDCDVCHYWHFVDKGFKFQTYVSNGCQNLLNDVFKYYWYWCFFKEMVLIIVAILTELAKVNP